MKSASLSIFDPVLIGSLRDQIAGDFAARIYDSIPEVSDCLDFEAEASETPAKKRHFERASQLLFSRRRELQSQISTMVSNRFEDALLLG